MSADAHPVHLHLVHFEVVSRHEIDLRCSLGPSRRPKIFSSVLEDPPNGDGIYVTEQPIVQHNGKLGTGKKIVYPSVCLSPQQPFQLLQFHRACPRTPICRDWSPGKYRNHDKHERIIDELQDFLMIPFRESTGRCHGTSEASHQDSRAL